MLDAWIGRVTARLYNGASPCCAESDAVQCVAMERLQTAGQWATGQDTTDPSELLYRALRLAPACYRRFELTAGAARDAAETRGAGAPCLVL